MQTETEHVHEDDVIEVRFPSWMLWVSGAAVGAAVTWLVLSYFASRHGIRQAESLAMSKLRQMAQDTRTHFIATGVAESLNGQQATKIETDESPVL